MATALAPTMAYSPKADDINFLINDVPELTEEERITLMTAMKKAQVCVNIPYVQTVSDTLHYFKRLSFHSRGLHPLFRNIYRTILNNIRSFI